MSVAVGEVCEGHEYPHEHSFFCVLANGDPDGIVVGSPCGWHDSYLVFHTRRVGDTCPEPES